VKKTEEKQSSNL